jgi:TetR/AcrR family tetracycline transcriptional repressor
VVENKAPRRRGRPPRISRERIVAAARAMDPATLTMQAVAEELGVDRKALNYHVSDRDGLLELVALELLSTEIGVAVIPAGTDWREAARLFAHNIRDALVSTGALFEYVRGPAVTGLAHLAPAEQFAQALIDGGFDEEQTAHALTFVAEFTFSAARDAVLVGRHGTHPQQSVSTQWLDQAPAGEFPVLRRLPGRQGSDAQLDFDLNIFIGGMERLLGD